MHSVTIVQICNGIKKLNLFFLIYLKHIEIIINMSSASNERNGDATIHRANNESLPTPTADILQSHDVTRMIQLSISDLERRIINPLRTRITFLENQIVSFDNQTISLQNQTNSLQNQLNTLTHTECNTSHVEIPDITNEKAKIIPPVVWQSIAEIEHKDKSPKSAESLKSVESVHDIIENIPDIPDAPNESIAPIAPITPITQTTITPEIQPKKTAKRVAKPRTIKTTTKPKH